MIDSMPAYAQICISCICFVETHNDLACAGVYRARIRQFSKMHTFAPTAGVDDGVCDGVGVGVGEDVGDGVAVGGLGGLLLTVGLVPVCGHISVISKDKAS